MKMETFLQIKEKIMILMIIIGPSSLKQNFKRKVGIESSSVFLRRENEIVDFSESGWNDIG